MTDATLHWVMFNKPEEACVTYVCVVHRAVIAAGGLHGRYVMNKCMEVGFNSAVLKAKINLQSSAVRLCGLVVYATNFPFQIQIL
jgi:hypothetical protein